MNQIMGGLKRKEEGKMLKEQKETLAQAAYDMGYNFEKVYHG
jgi:hypothetical protein